MGLNCFSSCPLFAGLPAFWVHSETFSKCYLRHILKCPLPISGSRHGQADFCRRFQSCNTSTPSTGSSAMAEIWLFSARQGDQSGVLSEDAPSHERPNTTYRTSLCIAPLTVLIPYPRAEKLLNPSCRIVM
jgi:hypothetical protein